MSEVWILGATGRCGRGVAAELAKKKVATVLVGRDASRLRAVGAGRVVVAADLGATVAALAKERPAVVVNTIGPFAKTAVPVARASANTHYVDVTNELPAVTGILGIDEQAVAEGRTLVTGAGFGFVSTESVVRRLCAGRPTPARVRVDAIPSLSEGGVLGEALAATIIDALVAGGLRYEGGRLVRAATGAAPVVLALPDGTRATTVAVPFGDLEAAQRASGAPDVVAASSEAPSSAAVRVAVPIFATALAWRPLRDLAARRLARVTLPDPKAPRPHSWGHARIAWADGTLREGWLRAGDAMEYTVRTLAEVAVRLARGEGRPGAWTACGLFGPGLAEAAGGVFVDGA